MLCCFHQGKVLIKNQCALDKQVIVPTHTVKVRFNLKADLQLNDNNN